MADKIEVKLKELFWFDNDTRKTNNRNPNILLSKYVKSINELIKEWITIEQIEDILKDNKSGNRILYKYLTQITLHLTVDDKLKVEFIKWFWKNNLLIFNENKTLGIKYIFIDKQKKQNIYNTLSSVDKWWKVQADSSTYTAYKMERFTTKEEYIALFNKYKQIVNRVNKDLFWGYLSIELVQSMFLNDLFKIRVICIIYLQK